MSKVARFNSVALSLVTWVVAAGIASFTPQSWAAGDAAENNAASDKATAEPEKTRPGLDRSGDKQIGEASIYSDKFINKTMADGNRMDPNDDNAASKTLPLGTKARVTNLETGESTTVTIQDRGPHVKGRIIDLPSGKAEEIGLTAKEGVTQVEVVPLTIPMPDGSVKSGKR